MAEQRTTLSVFVASPRDVQSERNALDGVVAEVNRTAAKHKGLSLELVKSETHVRPGAGADLQAVVNRQIEPEDIIICIFWNRLGTPTGRAASGTVEELYNALTKSATDRPPTSRD